MPVRVNCPCASVIELRMVPFRATVTWGTGLREVSSTRPLRLVTPPAWAPVTVSVIVCDEDATPSEARKVSVTLPTCVASGVKTNCPVCELNAACIGKGRGVTANVTRSSSGSVAVTAKDNVAPSPTVWLPIGARCGGPFWIVNGRTLDGPPPGAGFTTVTETRPRTPRAEAGTTTESRVGLMKVADNGSVPNCTVAPGAKRSPSTVTVRAGDPEGTAFGESDNSPGTRLV